MAAPKGNKFAEGNDGGRPPEYTPRHARQAYEVCLLGADNPRLARVLEVSTTTLARWLHEHEEFRDAVKKGRDLADGEVAKSLFRRARGFKHKAVKIFADPKTGSVVEVSYVERYPPDTTACIFWLKNRRPDVWRDRHQFEFDLAKLSEEQLGRIAAGEDPIAVVASTPPPTAPAEPPLPVQ